MLRFVVLFALVAAAFAEPEAELGMAGPGMVHHANGAVVPVEPIANQMAKANHLTAKFGMPYALPYALPYAPVVKQVAKVVPYTVPVVTPLMKTYSHIFKREAESEAEADPLTVYTHNAYAPYTYTTPYTYTHHPYTYTTTTSSVMPATYTYPFVNSHFIAKREAESEADPLTIYNNGYIPTVYNHAYPTVYNNAWSYPNYPVYRTNPVVYKAPVLKHNPFLIYN